ncbi:UvrD-helicase domain-containing protein [Deinococcus planocerae]|uniref:UvrD-helicase domain-containing protein n=1 Tax=Deinococcus planocerae TaxID=1737569 RepID=UPI000C7F088D|nr:UvrD-helicase domain-containing protein [Deinococcus planocerae]
MNQTLFDHLEAVRRGAKTTVRQKRTPSAYQRTILHDVTRGVRAITVEAGPGSGKTALLEMIAALILELGLLPQGEKGAFLAFNKDIVGTLKKVIPPEFDVRTVSSLGHLICTQNLSGLKFEPRKYDDLIREIVCEARGASPAARRELAERLGACVELHVGHALGLDPRLEDWAEAMDAVDAPILGAETALYTLTLKVLRRGLKLLQDGRVMSFTDQVLAPGVFGWRLSTPYRFLLVDELQDLSRAQLGLLQAATDEHTRVVGVGDQSQSIYSFNGADQDSLRHFTELFGAIRRPLSITYRCPWRHVALAQPFGQALEAAPGAPGGTLDDLSGEEFLALARPGDLVLCRTNAPLVDWCYRLVAAGIPAIVRGRDLARSLVAFTRDAATFDGTKPQRDQVKDSLPLIDITGQLNGYATFLAEQLTREAEREGRDPGLRLAGLADRLSAITRVLDAGGAQTLGQLVANIRLLFQGDPERSVVLSTVHRAKGQEAERVFILEPALLPHPKARTPQALQAERCLQFVAFTRSRRDLFFVDAEYSPIPAGLRAREGG